MVHPVNPSCSMATYAHDAGPHATHRHDVPSYDDLASRAERAGAPPMSTSSSFQGPVDPTLSLTAPLSPTPQADAALPLPVARSRQLAPAPGRHVIDIPPTFIAWHAAIQAQGFSPQDIIVYATLLGARGQEHAPHHPAPRAATTDPVDVARGRLIRTQQEAQSWAMYRIAHAHKYPHPPSLAKNIVILAYNTPSADLNADMQKLSQLIEESRDICREEQLLHVARQHALDVEPVPDSGGPFRARAPADHVQYAHWMHHITDLGAILRQLVKNAPALAALSEAEQIQDAVWALWGLDMRPKLLQLGFRESHLCSIDVCALSRRLSFCLLLSADYRQLRDRYPALRPPVPHNPMGLGNKPFTTAVQATPIFTTAPARTLMASPEAEVTWGVGDAAEFPMRLTLAADAEIHPLRAQHGVSVQAHSNLLTLVSTNLPTLFVWPLYANLGLTTFTPDELCVPHACPISQRLLHDAPSAEVGMAQPVVVRTPPHDVHVFEYEALMSLWMYNPLHPVTLKLLLPQAMTRFGA